jgi:hypothetical protein
VQKRLDGSLVALGLGFFQLLQGGAEAGPTHQMGHESESFVRHLVASQNGREPYQNKTGDQVFRVEQYRI